MSSEQVLVTPENRGPLVNMATWLTLVVTCLATFTKIGSKLRKIGRLQGDDFFMFAAMVPCYIIHCMKSHTDEHFFDIKKLVAIGQTIAIANQVSAGLGRHVDSLTTTQIDKYQKSGYAAQLLYILSLCLAKFAVLLFLATIAINVIGRIATKTLMIVNTVWAIIAMIAIASQCSHPRPWAIISNNCFNQNPFWYVVGTFDILVNLGIIALPIYVLYDIQMAWSRKFAIMGAFAVRVIVIPLAMLRMVYLSSASKSSDRTYADFNTAIVTEIDMNLSIIFACFPFLKPVMDGLQTGLLNSDIHILDNKKAATGTDSSLGLSTWSKKSRQDANNIYQGPHQRLNTQESITQPIAASAGNDWQDLESIDKDEGSAKRIKKTTAIALHYGPNKA